MARAARGRVSRTEVWRRWAALTMSMHDGWARPIGLATGLPAGRFKVLRRLEERPLTLRELADAISSDAPTTTVTVNDLEERGLVDRRPHPTNRRAKLVSLTAAGRAVVQKARTIVDRPPTAFAAISADDLAVLARIIETLNARERDEDEREGSERAG